MKIVKAAVIGLFAAASLALATGCDTNSDSTSGTTPSASPSPSKSATPTEAFTSAANLLRGTPYKFSLKSASGAAYEGSDDPLAGIAVGKLTVPVQALKVNLDTQFTQNDYYVKVGLPLPGIDPTKWYHFDPAKITSLDAFAFGGPTDPTGLHNIAGAVATAESAGDKQLKGTLDFTKATWGPVLNANAVKGLGDKAKAVPFEATIDDKGRLATLKVTVPAYGSTKEEVVNITYSDFGTPVKLTTPSASETAEAPETLYALVNGA